MTISSYCGVVGTAQCSETAVDVSAFGVGRQQFLISGSGSCRFKNLIAVRAHQMG